MMKRQDQFQMGTSNNSAVSTGQTMSTIFWFTVVLLFLGLAIYAGILWEQNAKISDVRFNGHDFTTVEELNSSFKAPIGQHPDSINFYSLNEAVTSLPYVSRTDIHVDARGRMNVIVRERQPLAMLIEGSRRAYVDEDGVVLPVILEKSVDVPLLHGFSIQSEADTLKGPEFEEVRDFLVAARDNEFGWITISEVAYTRGEGVTVLSQENGVKLLFGRGGFENKVNYWQAFYQDVIRTKGIENFSVVDLRYRNQIVTR